MDQYQSEEKWSLMRAADLTSLLGAWQREAPSLAVGLADGLERLVASGALVAGTRLPPERQLAAALSVSRGTVVSAYDRLRERGLARTRHGSGTVVEGPVSASPREAELTAALGRNTIFAGILSEAEDVIEMRGAYWVGDDLPRAALDESARVLPNLLQGHGYAPAGWPPLRQAIADQYAESGLPTRPEQVLVTTGAQQALALIAQLYLEPDDPAVLEEFTYPGVIDVLRAVDARLRVAQLDGDGVRVDALAEVVGRFRPRLVYLIPTAQNPTGGTLGPAARRRLAQELADWDAIVVDDEALAATALDAPPRPLASYGDAANLLTVGSLSKSMWAGLRIGWVRGAETAIARLARVKSVADLGTPLPSQVLAATLLGHAEAIRVQRVQDMRERYQAFADGMARWLPGWTWDVPTGGLSAWTRMPSGNSVELAPLAARRGVAIAPGTICSPVGAGLDRVRIPFGQPPDVLSEGLQRLGVAWQDYLAASTRLDIVV